LQGCWTEGKTVSCLWSLRNFPPNRKSFAVRSLYSKQNTRRKSRINLLLTKPKSPLVRHLRNVRDGLSALPLFIRLGKLNGSMTADGLVDFSLQYPAIAPLQWRSEFVEYARLVSEQRPSAALEIGSFRGGTLFVLTKLANPDATVISLDLPASRFGKVCRWAQTPIFHRFTQNGQTLHLLRADSHRKETLSAVSNLLNGRRLDVLFIDGDHTYAGVRADFEMYSPLVRSGGLVAFHDIAVQPLPNEVVRLWSELKPRYRHKEILHGTGKDAMGIGVLWL
jgi:cephalosporin hydroxylase